MHLPLGVQNVQRMPSALRQLRQRFRYPTFRFPGRSPLQIESYCIAICSRPFDLAPVHAAVVQT